MKLDEKYIKQSLINIIQNAIDAMSYNKNNRKKEIYIKLKTMDNYAVISIKDTGIGVKEEAFNKIFEPYYTTKRHGTGLGLTNVVRIIEAHNGNIKIESRYGKGSNFIIKLPLKEENQKFLNTDL
nr:HAMP domain-containing sensor histidine kinase [uncultured Brachyspira sp.]